MQPFSDRRFGSPGLVWDVEVGGEATETGRDCFFAVGTRCTGVWLDTVANLFGNWGQYKRVGVVLYGSFI